jgi:hypothetical protein
MPADTIVTEKTYTLKVPFKGFAGTEIKEVRLRRAKNRDLFRAMERGGGETKMSIALLEIISGLSPDDWQEMDVVDTAALGEAAKDFLPQLSSPAV